MPRSPRIQARSCFSPRGNCLLGRLSPRAGPAPWTPRVRLRPEPTRVGAHRSPRPLQPGRLFGLEHRGPPEAAAPRLRQASPPTGISVSRFSRIFLPGFLRLSAISSEVDRPQLQSIVRQEINTSMYNTQQNEHCRSWTCPPPHPPSAHEGT
ncbi:uncharacterized protein AAEQ78_028120 isoform 2-T2 [Lycaon pictus]